jgi:methylenetetrahydrofolate reductase (NADPH)
MNFTVEQLFDGFSFEATVKDVANLGAISHKIMPQKIIAVPYLPTETNEARIAAVAALVLAGFQPMPHFSARRIASEAEFHILVNGVAKVGAKRCLIIAGDPAQPIGPYAESLTLIESGAFEKAGVNTLAIAGHPEGHSNMSRDQTFVVLARKSEAILGRGTKVEIVTQFAFDADAVLRWLKDLRARGIGHPVRLGVAGPASLRTLLRFAALCGVASSASVIAKYGLSLTNLLGSSGPEKLIARLLTELRPEHGEVHLHFYPFGGTAKTLDWISEHLGQTRA